METNIEHLHDVIEGRIGGRSSGKSYTKCHLVAGHVETGMGRIYLMVKYANRVGYMMGMLEDVFKEHGLPFRVEINNKTIRSGNTVIQFLIENRIHENRERTMGSPGLLIKDLD